MTSFNFHYLLKAFFPNVDTWGIDPQHMNGEVTIESIAGIISQASSHPWHLSPHPDGHPNSWVLGPKFLFSPFIPPTPTFTLSFQALSCLT